MDSTRLKYLFDRYIDKTASSAELDELDHFFDQSENKHPVLDLLGNYWNEYRGDGFAIEKTMNDRILSDILNNKKHSQVRRIHFLKTTWFRYAAAIILVLGIVAYIFTNKQHTEKPLIAASQNKEPGKDKAILILSNGRKVVLDNSNNENISDGKTSIRKSDGILTYNTGLTSENNDISYNSMITPRGGQYRLVLPDGSNVWLNSASTIKYPVLFHGKNRMVELTGEAYFDIKENKKLPFIVKTQNAEVLVLGTAFNINSYSDEPEFSATLINGSVKVSAASHAQIISPGQQALLSNAKPDALIIKNDVDIDQVIAWQKGIFEFNSTDIKTIARQLSRWYDVDVVTEGGNNNMKFSGGITKMTGLENVLKVLEANGIKSKWQNSMLKLYTL